MSDTALGHVWIKPGIMINEALCLKAYDIDLSVHLGSISLPYP